MQEQQPPHVPYWTPVLAAGFGLGLSGRDGVGAVVNK